MIQRMLFAVGRQCFVLRVENPSEYVLRMASLAIPDDTQVIPEKDRFGIFSVEEISDDKSARDLIAQLCIMNRVKLF